MKELSLDSNQNTTSGGSSSKKTTEEEDMAYFEKRYQQRVSISITLPHVLSKSDVISKFCFNMANGINIDNRSVLRKKLSIFFMLYLG